MKILYLIREDFNEIVSPAYYELIQELKNQGHKITVANLSGKFLDFKCIKIKQFKFIDYPFGFINRYLFGKAVFNSVNPEKFDLVLSSMAETLFFLHKWKIPKTAVIHDNFSERAEFTPLIGNFIFKAGFIPVPTQLKFAVLIDSFFQKYSMKKADGLIFLNKEEKEKEEKNTKAKCVVIHNGIYPEKFTADNSRINELKEKYGKKIVLFMARIELQKNPFLFLEAAEKLREKNCLFLMAGKGPLQKKVINFIREKNLSDKVKFLGWVNEKEKILLLNSCSVYVLPSLFEPVSVSTLEAMACKKPVIVSDTGGLKEIVDDSTGIKISSGSLDELVKAINFLLDNPKKADELGLNGFNKIKKEFSWKTIAEQYNNFFKGLINEK